MSIRQFDLTPDPNVLIALTQTPLKQMDALCELIDNAIDSFSAAKRQGVVINNPTIRVYLPKQNEVREGAGKVRIIDNGPGLTPEMAENALRAGYSSNNQYDNLGLFGMGFNISTGKMGSITTVISARAEEEYALKVVIDLNEINKRKSYIVSPEEVEKELPQGTIVEISGWWPEGNANNGFIKALARYSQKKVRNEIGRRYASIIREGGIRIFVNDVECEAHEFCVWSAKRHVTHRKYGEIPARYDLDKVIYTQRKCAKCGSVLESFQSSCSVCGCSEIRTVEEHIRGWVGIQRYDSATEYGIDLIRNGRAIRIKEQDAFFSYTDEFNSTIKDYPIDGPYGRIVGEIHLNHVPVDFLKRDFQRSTPEWQRAMTFLRGDSSLQPNQPGAENNESPIFKLYQGYRKVREAGTKTMYMGYWDTNTNKPHRISREVENEFIERFRNREPGYYDDEKWWEKVEEADREPVEELPTCPSCGAQILPGYEECGICGHILNGKPCVSCGAEIPYSAKSCPICGESQEAEILKPWKCEICGKTNPAEEEDCSVCHQPRGTANMLSLENLLAKSNKDDSLSIDDCTVTLPNGDKSSPIKVNVYVTTERIKGNLSDESIPLYVNRTGIGVLDIFIDCNHKVFTSYQAVPELMIASEIADQIKILNAGSKDIEGVTCVSILVWQIANKYWGERLEESPNTVNGKIQEIFAIIKDRLAMTINSEDSAIVYEELTESQSTEMAKNIINAGEDISNLGSMKMNGSYLQYVGDDFIVDLFKSDPALFFDGQVWDEAYKTIAVADNMKTLYQAQIRSMYCQALDDLVSFIILGTNDPLFIKRTMCSLEFLKKKVIADVY